MKMTYVTLSLTGNHSAKTISEMLSPIMFAARQAFGIVAHRSPDTTTKKDLPHAFARFNNMPDCANDSSWHEPTVGAKPRPRKRPSLCEIRTLRLPMQNHAEQMESDA